MTMTWLSHPAPTVRLRKLVAPAAGLGPAPWRQTRNRLFNLELDAEIAEIRRRLEAERLRKHRHDLVNAFTAVEGAALIMARENLTATDRSTLAEILGSGLRRLRGLLSGGAPEDHLALVVLTTPLTTDPGWRDRIVVDVAPDLVVAGPPGEVAEALRLVLVHAAQQADSGPVTVAARRDGDRVDMWVHNRGPRLSARRRKAIIEADHGSLRTGAVEGIHVAVRLIREMGGVVRTEARPGGGESFGVSWPADVG